MKPLALVRSLREFARRVRSVRARRGLVAMLAFVAALSLPMQKAIAGCWQLHARDAQLRPEDCAQIWVLQWGRGSGKTRAAAEHTLDVMEEWGADFDGALVSKNADDVRTTMINDKRSGLIACARRRGYELKYIANKKLLLHPNGATLHLLSADASDFGRGLNLNYFWLDEISSWPRDAVSGFKAFIGAWRDKAPTPDANPIGVITTTPKPNAIMRYLRGPEMAKMVTITRQHSRDNAAHIRLESLTAIYGGTSWEDQELGGEMVDGAKSLTIDEINASRVLVMPEDARTLVAIDPAIDDKSTSDAVGIIGCGALGNHAYVLGDRSAGGLSPAKWARRAVDFAVEIGAGEIVYEHNQGGLMTRDLLRVAMVEFETEHDTKISIEIRSVWHSQSKKTRAEPVIAMTQQGRVHDVGHFPALDLERTQWIEGDASPNRMDAWAMGISALLLRDDDHLPHVWE